MSDPWRLVGREDHAVIVDRLELADRFAPRFLGYQFRPEPPPGSGLLLAPCSSVHTVGMRFAIDLLMLDRDGLLLAIRRGLRPWRAALGAPRTYAIVEIPASHRLAVEPGRRVALLAPARGRLPAGPLAPWVIASPGNFRL